MRHMRSDYNRRIQDTDNRIPANEPVFLLRAQDSLAADAVSYWAGMLEAEGGDPATLFAVREFADLMRRWPNQKFPDTPEELILLTGDAFTEHPPDPNTIDLGPPDPSGDPLEGAE